MAKRDDATGFIITEPGDDVVRPGASPSLDQWVIDSPPGANTPAPQGNVQALHSIITDAANYAGAGIPNRFIATKRALTGEQEGAGFVDRYNRALEDVNKQQQQAVSDYPEAAIPARTVGGLVGGMGAGAAVSAAAPAFRAATNVPKVGGGTQLMPRVWGGLVEGGLMGGAAGAGHTYSGIPSDYVHNAGMGSIFGAGIGGAAPLAARGAGKVYNWGSERLSGIPSSIAQSAQIDRAGLRNLPPGGMMPDAGPAMLGEAQGVAARNTPGSARLIENLQARDAEVNPTIQRQLDTFGPAVTPSRVEAQIRNRMDALGPTYEAVLRNARAIDNTQLANWLDTVIINSRGEAQGVAQRVRAMLDIPTNPGNLDPHPRAMQAARSAVRGMLDDANISDSNVRGLLESINRRMTTELQAKVPGIRDVDSMYAELGSQLRAIRTGSAGQQIFKTGDNAVYRPDEMAEAVYNASRPKGSMTVSHEGLRLQQAARAEMEKIVGTNRNDLNALERILGTPEDWNQQKLAIVFGQQRATQLMEVLQTLRHQREVYQKVYEGSQTAFREEAMRRQKAAAHELPASPTFWGDVVRKPINWAANKWRGYNSEQAANRIATMLSERDPAAIQRTVDQLLNTHAQRTGRERVIRSLIERGMISSTPLIVPQMTKE